MCLRVRVCVCVWRLKEKSLVTARLTITQISCEVKLEVMHAEAAGINTCVVSFQRF